MSHRRSSDDGAYPPPGDGDLPELPPGWAGFAIPDDPRELAAEAAQVRAELERDPNWPPRDYRQRISPVGPVIALALMLSVAVTSLLLIVRPIGVTNPRPAPLAATEAQPGAIGGLVPDLFLYDTQGRPVQLRSARPAMLLLVPAACNCVERTGALIQASRPAGVQVELVGHAEHTGLPESAPRVRTLLDPNGMLPAALHPPASGANGASITAVLVRSDGVISRILRDPQPTSQLQNDLAGLSIP